MAIRHRSGERRQREAARLDGEQALEALAELVKPWHENECEWGFNEQVRAQTGKPIGRDWQTWSAAMFLYACECVATRATPHFGSLLRR